MKWHRKFSVTRGKAELKIHTTVVITGNTRGVGLFSGNTADQAHRIGENNSCFVSRMKTWPSCYRIDAAHPPGCCYRPGWRETARCDPPPEAGGDRWRCRSLLQGCFLSLNNLGALYSY